MSEKETKKTTEEVVKNTEMQDDLVDEEGSKKVEGMAGKL